MMNKECFIDAVSKLLRDNGIKAHKRLANKIYDMAVDDAFLTEKEQGRMTPIPSNPNEYIYKINKDKSKGVSVSRGLDVTDQGLPKA